MHPTPVRLRRSVFAAWLPLAALAIVLTTLPDPGSIQVPRLATNTVDPVGASALRMQIDPETGALVQDTRPLDLSKAPELQEALSRSDAGLVQEYLPNGAVRVNLEGRFQNASVAYISEDGAVHTRCSDQLHELQGHMDSCSHASSLAKWEVK